MKGKKGDAGLPINVIIVAILALIVLIVVVAYFLGGFNIIGENIAKLFRGGVDDYSVAVEQCKNLCTNAQRLDPGQQKDSAFCTKRFSVDRDGDSKADKVNEKNQKCGAVSGVGSPGLAVTCEGVTCPV